MMIFLPEAENRTIISSFVWTTKHRNVTDRRTDRQHSGLHCKQCGCAVKYNKNRLAGGLCPNKLGALDLSNLELD